MKYYHKHLIISTIIDIVLIGLISGGLYGAIFYISREYAQWEIKDFIDWRGLLWPVCGSVIVYLILVLT